MGVISPTTERSDIFVVLLLSIRILGLDCRLSDPLRRAKPPTLKDQEWKKTLPLSVGLM
jgi:hypothetical protein